MRLDPAACRNVGEALAAQADAQPRRTALTIYRPGQDDVSLAFAELLHRSRRRAAALRRRVAPGDRVMIALPTGTDFVELFFACLQAGAVAVPVPPPSASAAAAERVAGVAADCTPALAYVRAEERDTAAALLPGVPIAEPATDTNGPDEPAASGPAPDALAVLQYSSGSTGHPRGVMLTHADILVNLAAMGRAMSMGEDEVVCSWAPLHHDLGLFAQLSVGLLNGAHVVLMAPTDFVRRPVEWLRMMDRFGATISAGPDFAFDLCRRAIADEQLEGLDLSRARVILDGAEPVHPATMRQFAERCARAGLAPTAVAPSYGLAEATVYVSVSRPAERPTVHPVDASRLRSAPRAQLRPGPGGAEVVSLGRSLLYETRIVDPETRELRPDGDVGEVWLSGPGIGRGYWNRPDLSRQVFGARLAGGADTDRDRTWLRTGDLGALLDGDLVVTGRIKDVLIVHGRNLAPHDLEHEAQAAHEALAGLPGAAFGVSAPDERIVLVHEVSPRVPAADLSGVAAAVTRRLTASVGAPVRNVLLVRRGGVRRTTSGKIQRNATRERFLAGELTTVYATLDPDVRALLRPADA
ncbi:fatty acyl-AMP ligase [Dactylosporangium vinaceum]|uniref:Fatty acyl-AMP ligase n=1 Tax=Dactylosporangium vinaceum TaxID=53362 RepID=A0ABV5M2R5_9ACTN|nr:fatty acyl-AMP ligase [Dactylosporangium vinaceum]UAB99890.1 fatty acyl-AMP ligase [Dactylosporangium vinaceum]